jgi:4-amino-4-deoxy-L-arabinose transferase-like glycosyltransferase
VSIAIRQRPATRLSPSGGIFVLALVIRLLAGSTLHSLHVHSNDSEAYRDIAHNLIHRHLYGTVNDPPHSLSVPYATRPPLVPLSLAAAYLLLGENPRTELLLLSLLGALTCLVVYRLGTELFGQRVGVAGGVPASLYPFFLVLSVVPLTESWNLLLYPLLALYILRFLRHGHLADAARAGVVLGLSALCKPVILSFLPMLLLLAVVRPAFPTMSSLIRGYVALGLAAALAIFPWSIRNYVAVGSVIPVSLQLGAALWLGSGPGAGLAISHLERGVTNGWDNPHGTGPKEPLVSDPVAADRQLTRLAVRYILDDPARFLRLTARKERVFWGAYSNRLARLSWAFLAFLSGCGILLTWRRWRELLPLHLLILHTALVPVFFTSMPRFRAPIEPLLLIFAGEAIVRCLDRLLPVYRGLGLPSRRTIGATTAPDRGEAAPV